MSSKITFETVNGVACRPFKAAADGKERRKGELDFITNSKKLEVLEVVLEGTWTNNGVFYTVNPNDTVYVKSDQRVQQWAKTMCTSPDIDGEFILVPSTEIVAIKTTKEE
jgi:hypothetical protein